MERVRYHVKKKLGVFSYLEQYKERYLLTDHILNEFVLDDKFPP